MTERRFASNARPTTAGVLLDTAVPGRMEDGFSFPAALADYHARCRAVRLTDDEISVDLARARRAAFKIVQKEGLTSEPGRRPGAILRLEEGVACGREQ